MAGVRVSQISRDLDVEDLKIYFSNSKHAGGKIEKIYFPLLNNDAVIFFRNQEGNLFLPDFIYYHNHDNKKVCYYKSLKKEEIEIQFKKKQTNKRDL